MDNLSFKDMVMSSKLFKFRVYLLKLLLILFIYGHLLVNKLFHKIFKSRFKVTRIKGLLLDGKSGWVLRFGVWVIWRI